MAYHYIQATEAQGRQQPGLSEEGAGFLDGPREQNEQRYKGRKLNILIEFKKLQENQYPALKWESTDYERELC